MNFELTTHETHSLTMVASFPVLSNKRRMSFVKDCSEDVKKIADIIIRNGEMKKDYSRDHLRVAKNFLEMDRK